jgi:hypothetical protein
MIPAPVVLRTGLIAQQKNVESCCAARVCFQIMLPRKALCLGAAVVVVLGAYISFAQIVQLALAPDPA